jgi:hypothetical protein
MTIGSQYGQTTQTASRREPSEIKIIAMYARRTTIRKIQGYLTFGVTGIPISS